MKLIEEIKNKAKDKDCCIILPEANLDERVLEAAKIILKENLSKIIVFGDEKELPTEFFSSNMCEVIDIKNSDLSSYANELYELRKEKGLTLEKAQELIKSPAYFACMLLKNNKADGMVAGAKFTTADTLRPALQIIKTKKGKKSVTGNMIMLKDGERPLIFGDVSLVEKPDAETLSEIAISNAEFMDKVLNIEPKVALLSYSTKGSAKSELVDLVKTATLLSQENSDYLIDGEMQVDSALDSLTAKKKGITSEVGGNANVLIFPDLNAGNIGYKLVSRLGGYLAVGPIMLNFNKPVNDLSRGCTVEEIINTVCVTKLMVD